MAFGINPALAAVLAAQGLPVPGEVAQGSTAPPNPASAPQSMFPVSMDGFDPLAPTPDAAPASNPLSTDPIGDSVNSGINSVGRPGDAAAAHAKALSKLKRQGQGDALMALGASLLSAPTFGAGLGAGITNYVKTLRAAQEKQKPTHEAVGDGSYEKVTDPVDDSVTYNRTPYADYKDNQADVMSTTKIGVANINKDARTQGATITADGAMDRSKLTNTTRLAIDEADRASREKIAAITNVPMDDGTVDYFAHAVSGGMPLSQLGLGMGRAAAENRAKIMTRVAMIGGEKGMTGEDQAAQSANYAGGRANVVNLQKQLGTVSASEQTALANGQQFIDASRKLQHQSKYPVLNSATQSYLRHTGDPDIAAMDLAANTFANEYAKVIAGTPNGGGVLSDSAREEAMSVLRGNYSMEQKMSAYNQAKKDMANRMAALHGSISDGLQSITNPGRPNSGTPHPHASGAVHVSSPAEAQRLAPGTHFIAPDGVERIRH